MPTREQIEKLKASWAADPCWDIEDTDGFEEYRDELAAFAAEREQRCEGTLLTARPEGHWVPVGESKWVDMAQVYFVEPGYEGEIDLYISGVDREMPIKQVDAGPVLAYLEAHAYQA